MSRGPHDAQVEVVNVASKDGTRIGYHRSGRGPALVLVHGTGADHSRWRPVLDIFGDRFTVCAVDRRGRGASGDADSYSLEREYEDLAAVVDSHDAPVYLLGHSHGGICALGASLLASKLDRMVLYEPPVRGSEAVAPGLIDRLESLVEDGRREETLLLFYGEVVGMTAEELESFRALPAWPARIAAAHTIPRELRAVDELDLDPGSFRDLQVPTLLLEGGDSAPFLRRSVAVVRDALPDSTLITMPGHAHVAIDTGTDLFAKHVIDFLTAPAASGDRAPHQV